MSRRVESSEDQESLGDHEDASKQGRSIEDIDADAEVTLVNETQERQDDDLMFDTKVLDDDEVFVDVKTVEKEEQSTKTGEAVTTTGVEDSAAPTIPTTEEQVSVSKPTDFVIQPLVKDKGKAMIEADFELAQRLQTEEQGEITIEERSRLFVELMNKRKKHFAMLRAEDKRRKPPTKAQKRNQMSTYLKNMVKSKKEIEESSKGTEDELEFDKSKKAESGEEKAKGSRKKMFGRKRAGKEKQQF
ncbi:hypothetical protein Tco_0440159 [Tanacetum coccineum]